MAIQNDLSKQDILDAIDYIDKNGIPDKNKSTNYDLVYASGKKYPPKYVVAVANHLVNKTDISTEDFNAVEAKKFLEGMNFVIETKQEKFKLIITANDVTSTDNNFTMNNLVLGDNYEPLDCYFESADGDITKRNYEKYENKIANRTLGKLTIQVFLESILALPEDERINFPVCQYAPNQKIERGIYSSESEFLKHKNSTERFIYKYDDDKQLVIYCWNIFSNIVFVKECLKRFGQEGDKFVLVYREKEVDIPGKEQIGTGSEVIEFNGYKNPYSYNLIETKNIILRGAPGTGKSYLAKEIAADIISNGICCDYSKLSVDQKKQIEFVQFHPSYDYTDFVEGLRPKLNYDGSMGFELQDGIFKRFVEKAKKNFDDSQKSQEVIEKEATVQEIMSDFFSNIEFGVDELETLRGTKFSITSVDDRHIIIAIPENDIVNKLTLNITELKQLLDSNKNFTKVKDVTEFFGKSYATQHNSYYLAIFNAVKSKGIPITKSEVKKETLKKYIFIIDEINRGEISKIFGELFFSIDPGYRGKAGEVSTQYSNLHDNPDEKFYIPENVYIIGTMNDIDRSVDSFDFAMRRRFRFIEIKADERLEMLDSLGDMKDEAIIRMMELNNEISKLEELNENYHIGASYFLKLKTLTFDQLWTDYLSPLLQDYIHGMYDEKAIMKKFAKAYGYKDTIAGDRNDEYKA